MYYLLPFRFERFEDSELLVNEVVDYLFCPQGTAARIVNREISEDEELEAAKDLTAQEFARYGLMPSQIPDDMLDNFAKERLAKNQDRSMIRSQVISQKITKLVKEKATLTQENISYEDFAKLFE